MSKKMPLQDPAGWVKALLDPCFACEVVLQGVPGRLHIPEGWSVRQEIRETHLFYFVIEGGFSAEIGGDRREFAAGDLLWVKPGTEVHFWLPAGKSLFVHRFRVRTLSRTTCGCGSEVYPAAWAAQVWMERIAGEASHEETCRAERLRGLLLCLFTELMREREAGGEAPLSRAQREELVSLGAAACAAGRWLRPADLARRLRLSPDYFTRVFRRSFGMPPRRWLMEQRVRMAAIRLEESQRNVSEVADEFGYPDVFLFSRQFKIVLGMSPGHYRRRHLSVGGEHGGRSLRRAKNP